MVRVLSIDPGGRTGIYYRNGVEEQFLEINKPWKETYQEIKELIKDEKVNLVLYEDTNFISNRSRDSLNLIRLLGALECLSVKKISSINVLKVKEMTRKLLNGSYQIKNLQYLSGRGKGWMWKGKRVSIHQLEAFIVYWLWKENN